MIDYLARAMEQEEKDREETEVSLAIQTAKRLFRKTDHVSAGEESSGTAPIPTGMEEKKSRRRTLGATAIIAEARGPVAEASKAKKTAAGQTEMEAREERSVEMAEARDVIRTLDTAEARGVIRTLDTAEARGVIRTLDTAKTGEGIRTLDEAVNDALIRRERAERSADAGAAPSRSQIETFWSLAGAGNRPFSAPEAAALKRTLRQAGGVLRTPRQGETGSLSLISTLRRVQAGADFARRERRSMSVVLPEAPAVAGGLSAEELDRTVERDARRYDSGFELY